MRKLASIQKIWKIEPIEGADRIELCSCLGWRIITRKGEFKQYDDAVYFEIDSLIPEREWSKFLFKPEDLGKSKAFRLRTKKMKGVYSQGLLCPLSILPENTVLEVGNDVTALLNIEKYEPAIPAQLQGKIEGNFPNFLRKTDSDRLASNPDILKELGPDDIIVGTTKYEGSSLSCYFRDGKFGVASRNLELKEDENNSYWKSLRVIDLEKKLASVGYNIGAQFELIGEGVQGNVLGVKGVKAVNFDFFNIDTQKYLDYDEAVELAKSLGIETAELVYRGPPMANMEDYQALADVQKYPNGHLAEGIVYKTAKERWSKTLGGRMQFKCVSRPYLNSEK